MSETITRRPRSERPAREVHREIEETPAPKTTLEDSSAYDGGISPEEALEDAKRQIQEHERNLAEARRLQADADRRAKEARAEAARAQTARGTDRQSVLSASIEQAKAQKTQAIVAYRLARETGNVDAELQATDDLSSANTRIDRLGAELEWMKSQPAPQPTQEQQQPGYSDPVKRWIDDHPKFNTDDRYRRVAMGAEAEAVERGRARGSQEYIDYINGILKEEFGEDHGRASSRRPEKRSDDWGDQGRREDEPARGSSMRGDAVPPSRRPAGAGSGSKLVQTALGPVTVRSLPNGSRVIGYTSEAQRTQWREAAEMSHMSEEEWANDQVECAIGGYSEIQTGDGRSYE